MKSGMKSETKSPSLGKNWRRARESGPLYTAISCGALLANGGLVDSFYHLISLQGELRAYKEFAKPVEISAADSGKIYAYGTGTLRVAAFANGLEQEEDLQDVYYAPRVHAQLLSPGKLESQGWDIRLCEGGMELPESGWGSVCPSRKGE
jgi:hypothetical protein